MTNAERITEEIFSLFEEHGNEAYFGEDVSQLQHAVQAAQLAENNGQEQDVILAALFHDIGHFCQADEKTENMESYGRRDHENSGAAFLRKNGFGEKVCKLISMHVDAKRYLCWRDQKYYNALTKASRITLEWQGGKMQKAEAQKFEQNPLFMNSILLREWDEEAKVPDLEIKDLSTYKIMCIKHLEKQTGVKQKPL